MVEETSSGLPVQNIVCTSRRCADHLPCTVQCVPDWAGWISVTTAVDASTISTVGYMRPILHPITEYATVQECLFTAMPVCKKLNQPITFVTFDYAAA